MSLALGRAKASKCRRAAVIVVDAPGGSRKGCSRRQGEGKGLLVEEIGMCVWVWLGQREGRQGFQAWKARFLWFDCLQLDDSAEQVGLSSASGDREAPVLTLAMLCKFR